jgi:hypothetical protein
MQEREEHDERSHQRVWELLPWYVNGTLSSPDRERVEDHLPGCRRCQDEVETCQRTAVSIKGLGEVAPSPHPVQLQRVLTRIDRMESMDEDDEAGRLEAGEREEQPVAAGRWFGVPRRALQALVAQAALIVLLVGALAWREMRSSAVRSSGSSSALYQTLSDPAPAPLPGGTLRLRLMFSPRATEKEIRDLLLAVHAEITAGPSPFGVYTVEITAAGHPVSVVLTRLRSDSVVILAEPAAGSVPAQGAR